MSKATGLVTIEEQDLGGIQGGQQRPPRPIAIPLGRDGSGGVMLTNDWVASNSVGGKSAKK